MLSQYWGRLPDDVDPRLWFEMAGCEGHHYLVDGNSHIQGRVYAYCPVQDDVTRVSKSEMTASSDEAKYFLRGFLSGSGPPPPPPVLDDRGVLVDDQDVVDIWLAGVKVWRETGRWPS